MDALRIAGGTVDRRTISATAHSHLAADVAGYSRLTSLDEEGTHIRLKEHLRVLIDPKVAAHRGHIVKNTGDGLLAEFNSVVDAMRCAVDVQRGMAERNSDVPPNNQLSSGSVSMSAILSKTTGTYSATGST